MVYSSTENLAMRTDIIFTTLCIGNELLDVQRRQFKGTDHYFEVADILIRSVLKNTTHSINVVTDMPDRFIKCDRVIVHDIRKLTDEPMLSDGYLNFHLKRFALKTAMNTAYKYVVYFDCDVFIETFNDKLFESLDVVNCDVAGRLGGDEASIRSLLNTNGVPEQKIEEFGNLWSESFFDCTLPTETCLIFKKNEPLQNKMLQFWDLVAKESLSKNVFTYYDSYYIATAIKHANMAKIDFMTDLREESTEFIEGLRIIHKDYVNTLSISPIELYNYKTLLQRVTNAI